MAMARYDELRYRLDLLKDAHPGRFTVTAIGEISRGDKRYEILRLEARGEEKAPCEICLAFGTHGNEDLSFESMYEFFQSVLEPSYVHPHIKLPEAAEREELGREIALTTYFFNPAGFDKNERTNGERHDLNRWFGKDDPPHEVACVVRDLAGRHFDASIDLHGDALGDGFMMYERTRLTRSLAKDITAQMREWGVAIAPDGDNAGEEVKDGVIALPPFIHALDDYLFFEKGVPVALTFEYPGSGPVASAVEGLVAGLWAATMVLTKEKT